MKPQVIEDALCSIQNNKNNYDLVQAKCKTIFIGAISIFETHFGSIWGHNVDKKTESQEYLYNIWQKCRKDLLSHGHKISDDLYFMLKEKEKDNE